MAKGKPKPPKRPVPLTDVEDHLREQLAFLAKSAREFDAGDTSETKRMALAIRVLLHDSAMSHSVAGQLGLKSKPLVAAGGKLDSRNLLSEWPLAIIEMGSEGVRFMPALGDGPYPARLIDFDSWWNDPVIKDANGTLFSRGDLILVIANQAGGAHVDPDIDERYHQLAKEHSIGWMISSGPPGTAGGVPLEHIEKVYVRHIAWEVLATFNPSLEAIIGNRGCACGSGRKARYCCSKKAPLASA